MFCTHLESIENKRLFDLLRDVTFAFYCFLFKFKNEKTRNYYIKKQVNVRFYALKLIFC